MVTVTECTAGHIRRAWVAIGSDGGILAYFSDFGRATVYAAVAMRWVYMGEGSICDDNL